VAISESLHLPFVVGDPDAAEISLFLGCEMMTATDLRATGSDFV
jgi:hypothetical protein